MAAIPTWRMLWRISLKASLLFVMINIVFALASPLPALGQLGIYNWLVPGRERLPYGVSPASYNLSPNSLELLFATHRVAQPKAKDEYRVLLFGDSSVWGFLLDNPHTLAGYLNANPLTLPDGRLVKTYNLGYLMNSITKDMLLIDYAKLFQPDLVIWLLTPESLYRPAQLDPAIVRHNPHALRRLIAEYDLQLDPHDPRLIDRDFWGKTLLGQRRALADWLRLQAYGFTWAATRIDQIYLPYTPRRNDFDTILSWHDYTKEAPFDTHDLAFDVLAAADQLLNPVPLLIVNEPIFIADGSNSHLHYNAWYPRWMYDRWRTLINQQAHAARWRYLDLWDSIAPTEFTDSPVHLTPDGSRQLSQRLAQAILALHTP